jgi:ubiquinone/menaquinone biosynthesis C-methylase UbiE
MLNSIPDLYAELPKPIRRPLWQIWHKVMIKYDKDVTANYMNYGYQGLNGDPHLELQEKDEADRYCIQLYDHVVNRADLKNKEVLEVGAGRGGGASYIARYYKPKSYIGLDISGSIIDFCNAYYDVEGLSFKKGIAEDLPYEEASFDAVVNVESARCYRSLSTFFNEVHRVLRDDGRFLFTDMIRPKDVQGVKDRLAQCGFKTTHETNITANVIEALDRDTERRERLIRKKVPGFLVKSFDTFAGTKGSERYNAFANGTYQYWSFVLEKI